MTKAEFLDKLTNVLNKNQIEDADEIIEEYAQHFAFKLADGYSEEEIAARLGNPEQLAQQYERVPSPAPAQSGLLVKLGLFFADIFAFMFFILLAGAGIVFTVTSVAFAASGCCLIANISPYSLIPAMPYWCGAIIGFAMIALGILSAVGSIYYWVLIGQFFKSFDRFQHNSLAAAAGQPILPSRPTHVCFAPRTNHRLRSLMLIALLAFIVCITLGFIACVLSTDSIQFWHVWGWFAA